MKLARLFTEHPASVEETYIQHLGQAAGFGARMLGAGLACLVHAVFPFAFVNTGSNAIRQLNDAVSARRQRAMETDFASATRKAVRP